VSIHRAEGLEYKKTSGSLLYFEGRGARFFEMSVIIY
jgi:hypothetical protein